MEIYNLRQNLSHMFVIVRGSSTLKNCNWIFDFLFQSVSTPQAMRRRLLKYFIPVLVMSLAFNIPKWFECYVDWEAVSNTTIVHHFNHTANQSSFKIVSKISFQIQVPTIKWIRASYPCITFYSYFLLYILGLETLYSNNRYAGKRILFHLQHIQSCICPRFDSFSSHQFLQLQNIQVSNEYIQWHNKNIQ